MGKFTMTKNLKPIVNHIYNLLTEAPPAPAPSPSPSPSPSTPDKPGRKTATRATRDKWESELATLIAKYKTGKKESWKDWLEDHPHKTEELADICARNPSNPLCPCPKKTPFKCPDGSCVKTADDCPEGAGPGSGAPGGGDGGPGGGGRGRGGGEGENTFDNPPFRSPVMTLAKLDNDGIKFWRNVYRNPDKQDKSLALMAKARKMAIIGSDTSPSSDEIDTWFGSSGRKRTSKTAGEYGSYDAIINAVRPRKRKSHELQSYFVVDASVYTDVAAVTNRPEEEIKEPIFKIVRSFLKRLIKSVEGSRNMVSIEDAMKTIKWAFRNKIGDEELQGVLSVLQTYGVVKGGGGEEIKPRRTRRRRGERRRVREDIDIFTDVVADILIEKFKK
jgi:hypothetical protein